MASTLQLTSVPSAIEKIAATALANVVKSAGPPVAASDSDSKLNAPGTSAAESDVDVTEAEIGLAEANFYPKVNIEADAGYTDDANGFETYGKDARVMLRGRWNLFRGGIDRANRQEAVFRMHKLDPEAACPVAAQLSKVLSPPLRAAESAMTMSLQLTTLDDVSQAIH